MAATPALRRARPTGSSMRRSPCIATEGWRGLSLAAIAAAAELPILQVYRVFPSKQAILCGLLSPDRRDRAGRAAGRRAGRAPARPVVRSADAAIRRASALQARPRRAAPRIAAAIPLTALCAGASLLRSMRWMLEAAEIPTGGVRGAIAVKLAAAAYLSAMRVWQRDDSPDLARTMAALDARLRRIEGWLETGAQPRAGRRAASRLNCCSCKKALDAVLSIGRYTGRCAVHNNPEAPADRNRTHV